jgi:hypothetical protein
MFEAFERDAGVVVEDRVESPIEARPETKATPRASLLREISNAPGLRTSIRLPRDHPRITRLWRDVQDSVEAEHICRRDARFMDMLDETVRLAVEDIGGPCYDGRLIAAILKSARGGERHDPSWVRTSIMYSPRTSARIATLWRRLRESAASERLSRRLIRLQDIGGLIVLFAVDDPAGPCYDGQLITAMLRRAEAHGAYRRTKREALRKGLQVDLEIIAEPEE